MKLCNLNVSKYIAEVDSVPRCEPAKVLFGVPFIVQAVEDDETVLEELLCGLQKLMFGLEHEKDIRTSAVDDLYQFCLVLSTLKPSKPDAFINSIEYVLSMLPSDITPCDTPRIFQHHAWLILSVSQLHIASRYLPGTLAVFYKLVDKFVGGLLDQAISRVSNLKQVSVPTLVSSSKSTFTPPREFGCCPCVQDVWKFLIKSVDEASKNHAAGDSGFWTIFNKYFNHTVGGTPNVSGLMWVFEHIVGIVSEVSPAVPVNWPPIQELTKQSCSRTEHLHQALRSLIAISDIWTPHIVIIRTLQEHFTRSLISGSSTIVPQLSPQQYIDIIESIVVHKTVLEDTLFQTFLKFYVSSLEKIPENKKGQLIKRIFQSDKLNHKTLCSMSSDSLQCLGLLVGACLFVSTQNSLTTQVNLLFGSQSGDMISNSVSPNILISLQIAIILIHTKLKMDCELYLEQLTVMLNRLSEDYARQGDSKQCQTFGIVSRMLENMTCLMTFDEIEASNFLGSWIEMFLDGGNNQRSGKVLEFCGHVLTSCLKSPKETGVTQIYKFVLKPLQKFLKAKSENLPQFEETIATLLSSFCIIVDDIVQNEDKKFKFLENTMTIALAQTNPNLSISALFVSKIIAQEKPQILHGYEHIVTNLVFRFLCDSHIQNKICSPEVAEHVVVLWNHILTLPQLSALKLSVSDSTVHVFLLSLISSLELAYQNMPFSDAQILKNCIWKMFMNISQTLKPHLDSKDEIVVRRLYQLVSEIFEKLPNLLYSPTKENSPLVDIFTNLFILKGAQGMIRKNRVLVLPKVFHGLSKISYKSNNLFFKDILKLFDDVYPVLSASDWKTQREDPFLTKLFTSSFEETPEKSSKAFRMSFMNYMSEPNSGYCKLPKDPDKLTLLLYFLYKLEASTQCPELFMYDFEKLYPFLIQVLFTCVTLKNTSPPGVESLVTKLLEHFIKQTDNCSKVDLVSKSHHFILQNINMTNGSNFVIQTFQRILDLKGHKTVVSTLEYLEDELKGRSVKDYEILRNNVLNCKCMP